MDCRQLWVFTISGGPRCDAAQRLVAPGYAPLTTKFPELAWDPSLFGITILAEFVRVVVAPATVPAWTLIAPPSAGPGVIGGPGGVPAELDDLINLMEYRPEVMSEALAQATDMVGYWAGMLMFSRSSHPWTFRLARIAIVVGEFVVMKLKHEKQRPRPSQLSPALMPPLPVPGHASYPSGHATQAYLLSGLMGAKVVPMPSPPAPPGTLESVMPATASYVLAPDPAVPPTTPAVQPASLLDRLAERVARNREVLGLHYRSDSEAGKDVAGQILKILLACPSMPGIMKNAHDEWK